MQNAEKMVPHVTLKLAGEERKLVCSLGTFFRFQDATGKDGMSLDFWKTASDRDFCTLIWCAAGGEESGLTQMQVADSFHREDGAVLLEFLKKLFTRGELTAAQKKEHSPASESETGEGPKETSQAA